MIALVSTFIVLQFLLLIPSFFFYRKILIKRTSIKKVKLFAVIATLVMPFFWTVLFTALSFFVINPMWRSKKFNSKDWIEDVDSRYRMVRDLHKQLRGKSKKEVINLLGNNYSNCWIENSICYVAYDPDNLAILDHYEFVVVFNDKNIVVRTESINR